MKRIFEPAGKILPRRSFIAGATACTAVIAGCAANPWQKQSPQVKLRGLAPIGRSTVALRTGSDRSRIVQESLLPFRDEVAEAIADKQVVIKVNAGMLEEKYARFSTHPDQVRGILEFLKPIYDRPVIISEGTASQKSSIMPAYKNYGHMPLASEYNVEFIDANDQPTTIVWIHSSKGKPVPVNVINTYLDSDIYLISAARMKTHDTVVATLSTKNVVMGSPQCRWREKNGTSDKPKMHGGPYKKGYKGKEMSYNMFTLMLAGVRPDLAVIDGIEAIEGNGPWNGDVIKHGVAYSSTDFVAADSFGTTLMGIDPFYMKYLEWAGDAGFGNFGMDKIDVDGPDFRNHIRDYKKHSNFPDHVGWIEENF